MDNWDEVRTAFQVARMGTVSGAAEVLGVHHATVIRHIDSIEARLGIKLFQRHARGYTPTEAGSDLLRVAQATEDQFNQLVGRLKGQGDDVSGELVVTSLAAVGPLLVPELAAFQQMHPDLVVRYLTGDRVFRLEYGEAHVAIRAGAAPNQPDNVVQPFVSDTMGLYASTSYVERHGMPSGIDDFDGHMFVGSDDENSRAPFYRWLRNQVSEQQIVFRCTDVFSAHAAIRAGAGIGFMSRWVASQQSDLVQVTEPMQEWSGKLWLVTHVDLHRTTKVQAFLKFLKERSKSWEI
ncbi:LysR family transcriptional regulator [Falsiruegeria mediterranea]|uniref:HTH-type transcriptional regulator DmlR n=1 Tax=Falsiruegeria mediterranea M17 TaxID=1200281 RepID=A0A2R8CCC7_9RHOB|nr:LysR family transcriptional regulator [Falsiruegeria mediterranea]SPJ30042.1 HTH-type transcriptional regulator DmlR [Falsiruegeria mediterranea M17]